MPRTTAEPDEAKIAALRGAKRQDTQIPFLINTKDARLIPNTPLTRKLKDYIPYLGGVADDLPTRQQFLQYGQRRRVVNTMPEVEVFDVGTATAGELVLFALDEYGAVLQEATPLKTLRRQVLKLAETSGQASTAVQPAKPSGVGAALNETEDLTT